MTTVGIVRYGTGNLDSVSRAFEACGGSPSIISTPSELDTVAAIVLPGVGAFAHGMAMLHAGGFVDPLRAEVMNNGIPILGICLGMQLLATRGFEGDRNGVGGLGWIDGDVTRLCEEDERVPHVGWNEVFPEDGGEAMFDGVDPGEDVYFVHSYRFDPANDDARAASTPYAGGFCSAVTRDHIWGVQFHPEKSQNAGFRVLKNFMEAAC